MYKKQLCLGVSGSFGLDVCEQIRLFGHAGFDGFFTAFDGETEKYRKLADEIGMIYQSIHAPFRNAAKMWGQGDEAQAAVDELLLCVKACGDFGVPIVIVHPYIGFHSTNIPTDGGISNFRRVVESAAEKGVTVAFENVEGEEYLAALENCTYEGNHLVFDVDGKSYEIYFVAAENGATTTLPVPNDPTIYTVSGNNYSGYIVTITRG